MRAEGSNGSRGSLNGSTGRKNGFEIRLPNSVLAQDEEYRIVAQKSGERQMRLHDYREIYKIPGLYEHLFCGRLRCAAPDTVSSMLIEELLSSGGSPSDLTVLELGAGNGMVGESLALRGVKSIVGVDMSKEAEVAARRDRPGVYDRYYVENLGALGVTARKQLKAAGFNCLVCVGALGFGDIPPDTFTAAYNLIADGGWVALNIKEAFVDKQASWGFSRVIGRLTIEARLEVRASRACRHRLSLAGEPLTHVAVIGRKLQDAVA